MRYAKTKLTGFSLIELMIAVAIVAIIAAIAVPSYEGSVQKSRRSDAKMALIQTATLQEQWYFQFNTYTNDVTNLGSSDATLESPEGFYVITAAVPSATEFTLTATAVGVQLKDTDCRTLTLAHTGRKASRDSAAAVSTECW